MFTLGWPNRSGGSLQSCYIWVQLPSPAFLPDPKLSKGSDLYFVKLEPERGSKRFHNEDSEKVKIIIKKCDKLGDLT